MEELRAHLAILLAAFLFANSNVAVRLYSELDVFLICLIVAFFTLIFSLIARIRKKERISFENKAGLIIFGATKAGTLLFLYLGLLTTTISGTMFLFYTAPVFALILAPLILKEQLGKEIFIALALALAGSALIFNPLSIIENNFSFGLIFAILSALCYAFNMVLGRKLRESHKPMELVFHGHLVTFIILLFAIPFVSSFQPLIQGTTTSNIAIAAGMALLNTIGHSALYFGLRRIAAQKVSILMTPESIFSILLGVILYTEIPDSLTIAGGALIILAVIVASKAKNH